MECARVLIHAVQILLAFLSFRLFVSGPSVAITSKQLCPASIDGGFLRSTNCSNTTERGVSGSALYRKCHLHMGSREEDVIVLTYTKQTKASSSSSDGDGVVLWSCWVLPILAADQAPCEVNLQCSTLHSYCAPTSLSDFRDGRRCKCLAPLFGLNNDGRCEMHLDPSSASTTEKSSSAKDAGAGAQRIPVWAKATGTAVFLCVVVGIAVWFVIKNRVKANEPEPAQVQLQSDSSDHTDCDGGGSLSNCMRASKDSML